MSDATAFGSDGYAQNRASLCCAIEWLCISCIQGLKGGYLGILWHNSIEINN
jgi:hypothetical protein